MGAEAPSSIIILGAGVIGLSIAHTLVYDHDYDGASITILARDMPGDLDSQAFASPWAGADWSPVGGVKEGTMYRWEQNTYNKLESMQETGLVQVLKSRRYYKKAEAKHTVWYRDLVKNYRELNTCELPEGISFGTEFDTVSVNPALYLPWLHEQLLQKNVKFLRKKIQSLDDIREFSSMDSVVARGQSSALQILGSILYADRASRLRHSVNMCHAFEADEDGPRTYIIPRPSAMGSVLLGGTYEPGNWDTSIDWETVDRIMRDCVKVEPSLSDPNVTKVISHNVGLRPARQGGHRVEREHITLHSNIALLGTQCTKSKEETLRVVHAYGFGGVGYQNSWGIAQDVARLVLDPWQ